MISFLLTAKRLLSAIIVAFKEKVFLSLITTLLIMNLSATFFYTSVEGWTVIDAIYFSWISLIPSGIDIGYGPVTTFGKIFTMMYLVVGVGIMVGVLAIIAKAVLRFDDETESPLEKKQPKKKK